MELKELQEQFSKFLYEAHPDRDAELWIKQYVASYAPEELESRLKVYRNNIALSLTGTLREIFPVTEKVLSSPTFCKIARDFIYSHPSHCHDLNSYGEGFPAYLTAITEFSHLPFLVDLANLELRWDECLELEDDEAMTADQAMEMISDHGKDCVFRLRSSARILETSYDILSLWKSIREISNGLELKIESNWNACHLIVWKDEFTRRVHLIEEELWPILSALKEGRRLGEIAALPVLKENSNRLSECLQVLLSRKWFSKIQCKPSVLIAE